MHEKLIREINGEIADALLARKMPFAPSRKAALALLKVPGWTEGLEQMLPIRGRLECAHVLELCSCVLPRLAPRPEEGWLAFCTQYARERMYPGQGFAPDREEYEAGALFFLTVLQVMLDRERRAVPFDPLKDFQFLSSEEMGEYECGEEYRRFLAAFREEYVDEMMRLSEETTPFRTLGHIAGVHYIARTVARGIREAGENVDLALVSAAAAAHDLAVLLDDPIGMARLAVQLKKFVQIGIGHGVAFVGGQAIFGRYRADNGGDSRVVLLSDPTHCRRDGGNHAHSITHDKN